MPTAQAVRGARLVIIGVKPAMVADLLREIADDLEPDAIVISVAAGVPIATMEGIVPGVVLRAMPNTPAVVSRAVTGIARRSRVRPPMIWLWLALSSRRWARCSRFRRSKIDALSTISGSGPAYVFYFIEQLTRTAIDLGFTAEEAATMVNGTFLGAAELLAAGDVAPGELRRRVTSPKGTTERAIAVLESANLKDLFDRATAAALERARELAAN